MPLRIIGCVSIILGLCTVAFGLNQLVLSKEIARSLTSDGHVWSLPVSREVFLTRSNIWSGVVVTVGVLTAVGGGGMVLRRRWGFHAALAATVVMLVFPLMTRLFLAKAYAFEHLSVVDFVVVSFTGLSASLAWMFRPR